MQKLWQEKLKLTYSKDIFDIVQFGSSTAEGKSPNDIDIAVIFYKIPLKEQLEQSQKIKMQLQKFLTIPLHIKSFDLYSFFDESNFARENILFYGKSLLSGDYFSKKFSLSPKIQIRYSLKNLKKKDKIRFNYMLSGKGGRYGLLKQYEGKLISPGLIEINPEHEAIFTDAMKEIISEFKVKRILY